MPRSRFDSLARALFRWRGVVGSVGFAAVFVFAHGSVATCLAGLPLIIAGLGVRFWASGYIGLSGRVADVGGERFIRNGPYRWFRLGPRSPAGHPLYFGNLLLVLGTLVAFRPAWFVAAAVVAGFVVAYGLMAWAEERYLLARFGGVPAAPVRFSFTRAATEWRTLLTVSVVYAIALARAILG